VTPITKPAFEWVDVQVLCQRAPAGGFARRLSRPESFTEIARWRRVRCRAFGGSVVQSQVGVRRHVGNVD
jgi:hypothetical protein